MKKLNCVKKENKEREKILGVQIPPPPIVPIKKPEPLKPTIIHYRRPKEGEVIWERIRR